MGNEINYNELFGLGDEDLSGEKGQSDADSDVSSDAMEENTDNDVADDGNANDVTDNDTDTTDVETVTDGEDDDDEGQAQSPEENAKYAAARRRAEKERDLAIEENRKNTEKYLDSAVRALNINNPFTGKVIETKAEYDEYMSKISENEKQEFMRKNGMSDADYNTFVDRLPEVRRAKEISASAEAARNAAELEKARAAVDAEIKRINAIDPTVKTVEDLQGKDNYKEIYAKVQKGYSLYDAYYTSNYNAIAERQRASVKQSVLNSSHSKEHLVASSQRGNGSETVPGDVAEMYRTFNPGATDAEIRKHYNSYIKK